MIGLLRGAGEQEENPLLRLLGELKDRPIQMEEEADLVEEEPERLEDL